MPPKPKDPKQADAPPKKTPVDDAVDRTVAELTELERRIASIKQEQEDVTAKTQKVHTLQVSISELDAQMKSIHAAARKVLDLDPPEVSRPRFPNKRPPSAAGGIPLAPVQSPSPLPESTEMLRYVTDGVREKLQSIVMAYYRKGPTRFERKCAAKQAMELGELGGAQAVVETTPPPSQKPPRQPSADAKKKGKEKAAPPSNPAASLPIPPNAGEPPLTEEDELVCPVGLHSFYFGKILELRSQRIQVESQLKREKEEERALSNELENAPRPTSTKRLERKLEQLKASLEDLRRQQKLYTTSPDGDIDSGAGIGANVSLGAAALIAAAATTAGKK